MHVVAVGNPFDGIVLHGPFETAEAANEWADRRMSGFEWWVVQVHEVS